MMFCRFLMILTMVVLVSCGGSTSNNKNNGTDTDQNIGDISDKPPLEQAEIYLENGDIENAQTQYQAALDADPDNAIAAFGLALTKLIMLSEHPTTQSFLSDLGQREFKISKVLGANGYFAQLDSIHKADVNLDGLAPTFYGTIDRSQFSGNTSLRTGEIYKADMKYVNISMTSGDNNLKLYISILYSMTCKQNDTLLGSFTAEEGSTYTLPLPISLSPCLQRPILAQIQARNQITKRFYFLDSLHPGSITFDEVNSEIGSTFSIRLNNVMLINSSDNILLNGTISDSISENKSGAPEDFLLPFGQIKSATAGNIFKDTRDSLTISEIQSDLQNYLAEFREIESLFALADQSNDFKYTLPGASYYSNRDVNFNRVDLKSIRASMNFIMMSIYMANSWSCDMNVGQIFDSSGAFVANKADLVEDLNSCFVLKEENNLAEAKIEFEQGLAQLLASYDALSVVTKDGILEKTPLTEDGYEELENMRQVVEDSLTSQQLFNYISPSLNLNLSTFFEDAPSASELSTDLFVFEAEDNSIKIVESAVEEFFSNHLNLDLENDYKGNFVNINRDFAIEVLDEFAPMFIVGHPVDVRRR